LGKDFYAVQTYNDTPHGDAIAVGWMSNWAIYASGANLSLARGVHRATNPAVAPEPEQIGALLVQTPISLTALHQKTLFNGSTMVSPGSPLTISAQGNSSFEFETTVVGGDASPGMYWALGDSLWHAAMTPITRLLMRARAVTDSDV
jgi:sucrose-6-phosphate hydrolase SacC (GH32 family)